MHSKHVNDVSVKVAGQFGVHKLNVMRFDGPLPALNTTYDAPFDADMEMAHRKEFLPDNESIYHYT